MKKNFFIFIFYIFTNNCFCQLDTTFLKNGVKVKSRVTATTYQLIYKQEKDFLVKEMYIGNHPKTIGTCSSVNGPKLIYEGKYIYYNDETSLNYLEGQYHANQPYGAWTRVMNKGKDTIRTYEGIRMELDSIYHDHLYIGIDNPITISITDIQKENIRVTATNGTIEGTNGKYIVRVPNEKNDTFRIYNGDKFLDVRVRACNKIPDPVSFIGKSSGDCRPSREEVIKDGCITVKTPQYDVDPKYNVSFFILSALNNEGTYVDMLSKGPCLTEAMKELIRDRDKSKRIFIEDVTAIGPDGKKKKIPGMVIKFDFDDVKNDLEIQTQKVNAQVTKIIEGENKIKEQQKKVKEQSSILESQNQLVLDRKQEILKQENEITKQKETLSAQIIEIKNKTSFLWIAIGIIIIVFALMIFSVRSYIQKKKDNLIITNQKHIVEEKQKEILDSIHYAKRIQQSLLPTEKYIQKNISRLKDKA